MKAKTKSINIGTLGDIDTLTLREILGADFSKDEKEYHNWKNYVPANIVENWMKLSLEARVAVYYTAMNCGE